MGSQACEQSDVFFVTILQGWAYKTQTTSVMHWGPIWWSSGCFLCNYCKYGLTKQNMRDFFVTTLQGSAVGNSPNFLNESPFHTFAPKFQPEFVVDSFDELSEMEIRSEKGVSCRRLARMGLQKQPTCVMHATHDAWFMRAIRRFLCNNIAGTGIQNMHDACEQSDVFFVTTFARMGLQNTTILANKKVALSPLGRNEYEKRR